MSNSHFKRTGLSVEEQIGRVKRPFAVTTGCSARFSRRTFGRWRAPGWLRAGRRAGAMRGGAVGSPRWLRMSRTVGPSVMKAMILIAAPQRGQTSGKTSWSCCNRPDTDAIRIGAFFFTHQFVAAAARPSAIRASSHACTLVICHARPRGPVLRGAGNEPSAHFCQSCVRPIAQMR